MNPEFDEKCDMLDTACILLSILQWFSPLLAACILWLLSVFVAPPLAKYSCIHDCAYSFNQKIQKTIGTQTTVLLPTS